MLKTITLGLAISFALPSTVFAADIPANAWSGVWDTIESVYPADDGMIIILKNHTYAGHGTGCNGGRQFIVKLADPNYEVKAKTLLAAYMAGHQITPYWTSYNSCRATINRFQVQH